MYSIYKERKKKKDAFYLVTLLHILEGQTYNC